MEIVRIEENGNVLILDEQKKLRLIDWDVLVGCEVLFPDAISQEVIAALEAHETPLPKKSQ